MRYYKVLVTSDNGQQLLLASSLDDAGRNAPGALQIELDIVAFNYATPMGGSYVRLWGVPLKVISQATNLNYAGIQVFGGMSKGLPLANPAQQGLLAKGTIFPAFGNWVGLEQTLDLVLAPPLTATQSKTGAPPNLVLNWTAGTKLSDALATALKAAYPTLKSTINISPNLVAPADQPATYDNLEQLSSFVKQRSQSIMNSPTYPGVNLTVSGDQITAYDGTNSASAAVKNIEFNDLIGQPTWMGQFSLQFKCPMRGDLTVGQVIKMPPTITTQTAQASLLPRNNAAFQGKFLVQQIRHTGSLRQADATAWVTTVDAVQL